MRVVLGIALLVVSLADAQNVQQLYATDLTVVPGLIEVSPGYPTTLELYGQNDAVISGDNNEVFLIEELGNQLVIKTASPSGAAGLQVVVLGRRLLFEVRVNVDEPMIRSYPILEDRGRAYSPATAVTPVAPSDAALELGAEPLDAAQNPVTGKGLTLRPASFDARGDFVVFFTYQNGSERLALDPTRLSVSQGGEPLQAAVNKEPLSNLLSAGESQSGLIRVSGAVPGDLEVAWEVVEITPTGGKPRTVKETVRAE